MKLKILKYYLICILLLACAVNAQDFSGTYLCKGDDKSEGLFEGEIILKKLGKYSDDVYASYDFSLRVAEYGLYKGFAASQGLNMAIYFALDENKNNDYGVGIAEFKKTKDNLWSFQKFYFQPRYKDGNKGFEECVQVIK